MNPYDAVTPARDKNTESAYSKFIKSLHKKIVRPARNKMWFLKQWWNKIPRKRAWLGLSLILGSMGIVIAVGFWGILSHYPGQRQFDSPPPGEGMHGTSAFTWDDAAMHTAFQPSTSTFGVAAPISQNPDLAVLVQANVDDTKAVTVYSTTTVHLPHIPTAIHTAETMTTATSDTLTVRSLDMTATNYCLFTALGVNPYVYTPCKSGQSSPKDSQPMETNSLASAGDRSSKNPMTTLKVAVAGLWDAGISMARSFRANDRHRATVAGQGMQDQSGCPCQAVDDLQTINDQLSDDLARLIEMTRMQQELLSSQHQIIKDQRFSIEEITRLWDSFNCVDVELIRLEGIFKTSGTS